MSEAVLDIKRWSNNRGARPPAAVARAARSTANRRVRITVEDGRVIVAPHDDPPIDCNPQAGSEMRDLHPLLVRSPGVFNARTELVVGLPMTTAEYNASNPFAVAAAGAGGRKAGKIGCVSCHQPESFDWRARGAKPHAQRGLGDGPLARVCLMLKQIIGAA